MVLLRIVEVNGMKQDELRFIERDKDGDGAVACEIVVKI